ncbi:ACT domain-containing protein [Nocardioides sp. 31GB23]|uniref:glycine cleavage system protein R n=1 Tax=Nocardioides sp. 31GB23 TaxID=3156065 RepID=UPI0032AF8878
MASLLLTVIGDDRPGLVSAVSALVEARGGSWQRSQLTRLAGKFAGIALVEVPDTQRTGLEEALAALAAEGLSVRVEDAGPADAQHADGPATFILHLVGQDHPGIVAEISSALAARGVGIEELLTDVVDAPMGGGTLFEARATLRMPPGTDAEVRADLERLADELMVDLELDPAHISR